MKELKDLESREVLSPRGQPLPCLSRLLFLTSSFKDTEVLTCPRGLTRNHCWELEIQDGREEEAPAQASSSVPAPQVYRALL